jgi:hypothetical protein
MSTNTGERDTPAAPTTRRRYDNGPAVQAVLDAHGNGTWGGVRLGQIFDAIEEAEAKARAAARVDAFLDSLSTDTREEPTDG